MIGKEEKLVLYRYSAEVLGIAFNSIGGDCWLDQGQSRVTEGQCLLDLANN